MTTPASIADVLDRLDRTNPGRPVITAYDEANGARVELSAVTYLNWVNKTANLLADEYLVDPGDTLRLDIPSNWIGTVFIGAAWRLGLAVTTDPDLDAAVCVRGPGSEPDPRATATLACSLTPFATRLATPPADGVDDFGALWPGQPDVFFEGERPAASAIAWRSSSEATQADLLGQAREQGLSGRVLTDLAPTALDGALLAGVLAAGSFVLVSNPADAEWPSRYASELADLCLDSRTR